MENKQLVSPSRQCYSTPVGIVQSFLNKEQHDNTGAFPVLAPADFYLFFHRIQHFCDAIDTIRNATKELKRLSENDFQECF